MSDKKTDKNPRDGKFYTSSGTYDGSAFNPDDYDDCSICRLMCRARDEGREPTGEELLDAFAEANVAKKDKPQ